MATSQPDHPLTDSVVGFCRFVREEGYNVGMRETFDAVRAANLSLMPDKTAFRDALRVLLCSSFEEWSRFEALFERFWSESGSRRARNRNIRPTGHSTQTRRKNPLLMIGAESETPLQDEGSSTTGASALERLRRTDFSQVVPQDRDRLEELVTRLARSMRPRPSRRMLAVSERRHVDLRRTIRRSITYGGDPLDLRYRGPRPRKPRLVTLLDVSGSMDQYSFFLFRFIHALQPHFERIEAFVFSTRLRRITRALKAKEFSEAVAGLSDTVDAWSSGTRIGACLETFNTEHARRMVAGNTIVLILSDGLDTGEPELLVRQLEVIRRRARKLIWLNPLSGMEGFRPASRGMASALPLVDAFVGAYSLESLLELETHLSHV